MGLLNQFQGVFGSILLGGLFFFCYDLLKSIFKHHYFIWLWIIIQLIFFFTSAYLYYLFMCFFTYGVYNIFFTLSFLLGLILYHVFYASKLNFIYDKIFKKIDSFIIKKQKQIKNLINKAVNFFKKKKKLKLKRKKTLDKK